MKSLILKNIQSLEIADMPMPVADPQQGVIKVEYCGICKTDAKTWEQGHRDLVLPRVLGHEFCGINENGRRVLVWPGISCGNCEVCHSYSENLCPKIEILGFHCDGGMAEYALVPKESMIPLDDDIPGKVAIFAEPLACGMNALEQIDAHPGESILIVGGGTCGLLVGLVAKIMCLRPVIFEKDHEKAIKSGPFRKLLDIDVTDSMPEEGAFDLAVNAAAGSEPLEDCIRALKQSGRLCFFSGLRQQDTVSSKLLNEVHYRQLRMAGAYGCIRDQAQRALQIIKQYQQHVEFLIEKEISLEEVSGVMDDANKGSGYRYIIKF